MKRIRLNIRIRSKDGNKCYYSNLNVSSNDDKNKQDKDERLQTDYNILSSIIRTIWPSSSSPGAKGVKG